MAPRTKQEDTNEIVEYLLDLWEEEREDENDEDIELENTYD